VYFSSNSSRVASFATTICVAGTLCFLLTAPPQPQEIAATVVNRVHANACRIRFSRPFTQIKQSNNQAQTRQQNAADAVLARTSDIHYDRIRGPTANDGGQRTY
jgi:hypothetical protein